MSKPVRALSRQVIEARAPMRPDILTLIAVSALAYVLAVALHEHLGHASACVLLGSHATELGAFYIECDDSRLSPVAVRLVALAGPLVSLLIGVVCYLLLRRRSKDATQVSNLAFYFIWLLGSIAAMSAAGYPLFSGFTGGGDLGMSADGAFYGIKPAVAVRAGLVATGLALYTLVVRISLVTIERHLSGVGGARIGAAERIALTSYGSGAVVSLLIGLLNPHGMVIVLTSALASSMGGTSGLAWMMFYLNRRVERPGLASTSVATGAGSAWRWWSWSGMRCCSDRLFALSAGSRNMAAAPFQEKSLAAEQPKADYGIDAPNVIRNLILIGLVAALAWASPLVGIWSGVLRFAIGTSAVAFDVAGTGLWVAMVCCFMACWMIYDSKVGKLALREELLGKVNWIGSEQVLDVGCGRGLLLIGAAKRLKTGRAVGIDLWQSEDLSNNNAAATIDNARIEGVADRVEVQTGDMRHMPFVTGQFDVIVSRAAIHNLYQADQRDEALHEIVRVVKPGGVILIDDIRHIREYQHVFSGLGCTVTRSGSELMSLLLMILTWGSLRPGTLLVRKSA